MSQGSDSNFQMGFGIGSSIYIFQIYIYRISIAIAYIMNYSINHFKINKVIMDSEYRIGSSVVTIGHIPRSS